MLRRVRQTARCHQILLPGFVGGGSWPCITHNDVANGWTSTVHRQDKHTMISVLSWCVENISASETFN